MSRMLPLLRRFWLDLAYQVSSLPASILAFTVVVAGVSLAAAAIGIIVGLPLLLVIFAMVRWNARLERRRTGWARGERDPARPTAAATATGCAACASSPATRRAGRTSRG